MSELLLSCELKLLTASKDVGLRRWRSFAAALGATGQIFNAAGDLLQHLSTCTQGQSRQIVIYDQSLPLGPTDLARIQGQTRLFILRPPLADASTSVPLATAPAWQAEAYLQCSLLTLLDSPVIRVALTQLVLGPKAFEVESLLRWGYAVETCAFGARPLDNVSQAFIRGLNLTGEARRLTEMFTHFLQARLSDLQLHAEAVTFGSDGILTLVSARCQILAGMDIRTVAAELRIHDMHITLTNRLPSDRLEIAGLFHPQPLSVGSAERMLLVFNKSHLREKAPTHPDSKAGANLTTNHTHKAS